MSKTDYVQDTIYAQHVKGRDSRRFLNAPASTRQGVIERFYRRKLFEMSIARFSWSMPESVNVQFMEKQLINNGLMVFLFDPRFGQFMAVRGTQFGQPNYNEEPTRFRLLGSGGYPTTTVSAKHCVPIWGSISRMPDTDIIEIYAKKLAFIDTSIEINSENARRTKVIVADEDDKLTMANVNQQLQDGDPAIFVRAAKGNDLRADENVYAIDMGIDVAHIERLHILKVRLWNECMTMLGIDGGNQDKKERQITSEVEANEEQVNLIKQTALYTRELAAEQINRMWPGIDVSVRYNSDIPTEQPMALMGV